MKAEYSTKEKGNFSINLINCGYCENGTFDIESISECNYRLMCINRGNVKIEVDGITHFAEKNSLIILFPHSRINIDSEIESIFYISFGGSDIPSYLEELSVNAETVTVKGDVKLFNARIIKFTDALLSAEHGTSSLKANLMLMETISSLDTGASQKNSKTHEHINKAIAYINANYMTGITAGDVSGLLGIDRTHFFRIFKSRTGLSPEQYIIKKRIVRAKSNLENTDMTVAEITADLGIKDIFYFSKLFKKETGMSPTEYRKQYKK